MDTLKLSGREFQPLGQALTAAQDDYLMAHLRASGALEVLTDAEKQTPEKKSEELLTRILLSGRKQQILAGVLVEVGKRWTREDAERNATMFGEITEIDEKRLMYSTLVSLVLLFFRLGERSSTSSPTSSSQKETAPDTSSADPGISGTGA